MTRAFLARARDWTAYLLADLEPPYRRHARFYLAGRDGRDEAVLLHYAPPEFTSLVAYGERAGVAAALAALDRPASTALVVGADHREDFERYYAVTDWRRMRRMALTPAALRLPSGWEQARRLGMADLAAIERLFGERRDHSFYLTAEMLASGVYVGVEAGGRLVAVAGTHVVAPVGGVAAIGNVYTTPAARGQGFGRRTTAAVARALGEQGIERIVLNVQADNGAAISVYDRLGFATVGEYWEADEAEERRSGGAGEQRS